MASIEAGLVAATDESVIAETAGWLPSYVQWGSVVAGAVGAAGLGFVLHGFAAAIGLSLTSTSPTWRDSSFALTLLGGLYLIFAAVIAYGLGGYVAGRSSSPIAALADDDRAETEFRDGMNGLVAWALATLLAALIALGAAQAAAGLGGRSGVEPSSTAESLIAFDLDRLFRSDHPAAGDIGYARAEAGRILLTANSHRGVQAEDHDYLVRLVGRDTGLSAADAARRVDDVVAKARDNVARARKTGVIFAFMAAAAAMIGAAVAWAAACAGGRHRDNLASSHLWHWQRTRRRLSSLS